MIKELIMTAILKFSILLTTMICMISGCSKAQNSASDPNAAMPGRVDLSGRNVLIVYLSRTKNTKAIAEIIQKTVGGKLVSLEDRKSVV